MKRYKTTSPLMNGYSMDFYTSKIETVCECKEISYFKRIAVHTEVKTLKQAHESVTHLFKQYLDDANRQIVKSR